MERARVRKTESVVIEKGEFLLTLVSEDGLLQLLCDLEAAEDLHDKLGFKIAKLRSRKSRFERLNEGREVIEKKAPEPKMRDYEGKLVQLRFDVETRGGEKFRAGEVLRVDGHWRGGFHMTDPNDPKRHIRHVKRGRVELLEAAP